MCSRLVSFKFEVSDYTQWSLQETEKWRRGYPIAQSALLLLICAFLENLLTMGILNKFLETSILYLDTFSDVYSNSWIICHPIQTPNSIYTLTSMLTKDLVRSWDFTAGIFRMKHRKKPKQSPNLKMCWRSETESVMWLKRHWQP